MHWALKIHAIMMRIKTMYFYFKVENLKSFRKNYAFTNEKALHECMEAAKFNLKTCMYMRTLSPVLSFMNGFLNHYIFLNGNISPFRD